MQEPDITPKVGVQVPSAYEKAYDEPKYEFPPTHKSLAQDIPPGVVIAPVEVDVAFSVS